ncbi:MAG: APC family permease, partial [Gemmatimonadota bacterium]|nr:APC family permease [Gemmatimonadota bacterium]
PCQHYRMPHPPLLLRAIGVRALAATAFNVTVGGGIFRLPAEVAGKLGAAAPLAYLVCIIAIALIVLCFAEAGSRVSMTGGPYAYVEIAFGPFVGFLAGVLLWLLGSFAAAAVAWVFAASLAALWPALDAPVAHGIVIAALFLVLASINIRGVKQGSRLIEIVTVAKMIPLLAFVVIGAFAVHAENLAWPGVPDRAALGQSVIVLIFAFAGIESALVPSGEVKDPARTVPRGLAIAAVAVTLFYIALQLVAQGILGPALASDATKNAPLAAALRVAIGPAGALLMIVGAVISTFGHVSGMTLATPRALYAFGRDGFLPSRFAAVHPRFHTPYVAIAVQAALAAILAISGKFLSLVIIANASVLLLYFLCCLATWKLRRDDVRADGAIPFRVPGGAIVPWLACAVIVWILSSTPWPELRAVGLVLIGATIVFALTARSRASRVQPAVPA